jgi:hypothetical protein
MIYKALSCVAQDMSEFLKIKHAVLDDRVILSGIVNQDGSLALREENRVVITLQNIERDFNAKNDIPAIKQRNGIHINLYLLFSLYFPGNNYIEALKFLSTLIEYFQQKSIITHSNTPTLDNGIDKLVFEMQNMTTEKQSNVWATLGAKYMPSVLYKMRMLTIDTNSISEIRPPVSGILADHTPKQ